MEQIKSKEDSLKLRLGSDVSLPINNTFKTINGLELLIQDIEQLLLTVPGERVMRPTYGCNLRNQLWENLDIAADAGAAAIQEALDTFEPRITTLNVDSTVNDNTGLITFNIQFIVNSEDTELNLIFPFRSAAQLSAL